MAAPAEAVGTDLFDFDGLREVKSSFGTAGAIVMDKSTDIIKAIARISAFFKHESCGQCTPCREGTGWMHRVIERIYHGKGRASDLDLLNSVADNIQGRTICALGDAAAMPVRAMIKNFKPEFVKMIEEASATQAVA